MSEILKSDIFFFITSIAIVVITVAVLFVLYYVYKTVRNVKSTSDTIKKGTEEFIENMREDRSTLHRYARKYGGRAVRYGASLLGDYVEKKVQEKKKERQRSKKHDE